MSYFPLLVLVADKDLKVITEPTDLPVKDPFRVIALNYSLSLVETLKSQFPELYDSVSKDIVLSNLISLLQHENDLVREQTRALLIFAFSKEYLNESCYVT